MKIDFVELDKRYGERCWRTQNWINPNSIRIVSSKIKEYFPSSIVELEIDDSDKPSFIYVHHLTDADNAHFVFLVGSGAFEQ